MGCEVKYKHTDHPNYDKSLVQVKKIWNVDDSSIHIKLITPNDKYVDMNCNWYCGKLEISAWRDPDVNTSGMACCDIEVTNLPEGNFWVHEIALKHEYLIVLTPYIDGENSYVMDFEEVLDANR